MLLSHCNSSKWHNSKQCGSKEKIPRVQIRVAIKIYSFIHSIHFRKQTSKQANTASNYRKTDRSVPVPTTIDDRPTADDRRPTDRRRSTTTDRPTADDRRRPTADDRRSTTDRPSTTDDARSLASATVFSFFSTLTDERRSIIDGRKQHCHFCPLWRSNGRKWSSTFTAASLTTPFRTAFTRARTCHS